MSIVDQEFKKRFGIQITSKCDYKCIHCLGDFSPNTNNVLSLDNLRKTINEAKQAGIQKITFTGGEALLEQELVFEAISLATSQGIVSELITNGSFFKTPENGIKILNQLKNTGLGRLAISFDIFHLKFFTGKEFLDLVKAAEKAGLETLVLTLLSRTPDNLEILSVLSQSNTEILFGLTQSIGRANDLDSNDILNAANFNDVCKQAEAPLMTVDGIISMCCGLAYQPNNTFKSPWVIGDITENNFSFLNNEKSQILRDVFSQYSITDIYQVSRIKEQGILLNSFKDNCAFCKYLLENEHEQNSIFKLKERLVKASSYVDKQSTYNKKIEVAKSYECRPAEGINLFHNIKVNRWSFSNATASQHISICSKLADDGNYDFFFLDKKTANVLEDVKNKKTISFLSSNHNSLEDIDDIDRRLQITIRSLYYEKLLKHGLIIELN